MKRIDSSSAITDMFGTGKKGFTAGNVQTGVKATALNADYCNGLQEEIMAVIEGEGLTPDGTVLTQLYTAIKKAIQRCLGNWSKANYINVSTTLTAANAGQLIVINAASTTQTLPLSSTCPSGTKIGFYGFNTGNTTIAIQGSDTIDAGSTANLTSLVMESGGYIEFTSSGGGLWMASGTSVSQYSAKFAALKAQNGYQKLPSGLIIQWGVVTRTGALAPSTFYSIPVTFPVSFPNATLASFSSTYGISVSNAAWLVNDTEAATANGMNVVFSTSYTVASTSSSFFWFAIGY
jgi:hypothetical protein